MRRKLFIIFIAIITSITMITLNVALLFMEKLKLIIGIYIAVVAVISVIYGLADKYYKSVNSRINTSAATKLLENINAMVILWETDFSYVSVNKNLIDNTGYSEKGCRKREILHKLLPDQAFSPEGINYLTENHEAEFTVECADGSYINTIWNTSVLNKTQDYTLLMSIGVDITESKLMQKKLMNFSLDLQETQSRYSLSMELSEIGILLRKTSSEYFFISKQLQSMLNLDKEYIHINTLRELIHPHDRVLFDPCCNNAALLERHKIHNVEMRIVSNDHTYHWYSFRYKVTDNDDGDETDIGGAIMDITADKEKDSLIEKMAYIDEITQIYNRNKFMLIGQEAYSCAKELNIFYWVIVIDIDKFHIINDTCGYENGNRLLKNVALVILKNLTAGGFGARIGGDNFAMILKDTGDNELPARTIHNIQKQLSELAVDVFSTQTISCSSGYCLMPADGCDFSEILDHAEFALRLNDDTRGTIFRYDKKMHENFIAGNVIEKELEKALERNELVLYYQPKINLSNGEIFGVEALIRWIKPNGTIIPPNMFIPVAEKSMLITEISEFVLHEACRQNKEWQDVGLPQLTVSVNLTSVDFYQTDVKESIHYALEATGLSPEFLEVELTESLALKDVEQAIKQMHEIKALGVKLAMDDFGTGYSSLSYIQVLPITLLKLDRSFIMYLEEDEVSREIVSAVIKIAKSKKIETIAEGIETIGQAEILRQSGCDHAQGYFFGKPMPAADFKEYLKKKMINKKF